VTVTVDAVIFFEIIDAEQALCAVDDYRYLEAVNFPCLNVE
jgi:hypothetical protein